MDICDKIDMFLYESIEDKIFDTFDEASEYLHANFGGHGRILHWPSKQYLRGCKCRQGAHQVVYSKEKPERDW